MDFSFDLYTHAISPVLQIGLLTGIIYWLLRSLERIAAGVKLKGLALVLGGIAVAAYLADLARLQAISWLLENTISFAAVILAIVFQSEVRRLFTRMGRWLPSAGKRSNQEIIDPLVEAVSYMAERRIGALIVLERSDHLDDYIDSSPLDCDVTGKSLPTLFWKDSPLHDGAVIVRDGRVAAAGAILPLTENHEFKDLHGTRHRAGIGISEDTDALAILVSEETGTISLADRGRLVRGLNKADLEILLRRSFTPAARRSAL